MSCMHFLLGILANAKLIEAVNFFPTVWPIILACIGNSWSKGKLEEERVLLALRAHALAAVCLDEAGTAGRATLVQEYFKVGITSLEAKPSDEVCRALLGTAAITARDLAKRCDRESFFGDAHRLQRWLWQTLGSSVLRHVRQDENDDIGERLFKVLCAAAAH